MERENKGCTGGKEENKRGDVGLQRRDDREAMRTHGYLDADEFRRLWSRPHRKVEKPEAGVGHAVLGQVDQGHASFETCLVHSEVACDLNTKSWSTASTERERQESQQRDEE